MVFGEHNARVTVLEASRFCVGCGERLQDSGRFCAHCGKPADGETTRARPSGLPSVSGETSATGAPSVDAEFESPFVPLPGIDPHAAGTPSRRKRRRTRRPVYRRQRVLVPTILLALLVAALVPTLYWTGSTLSTLRQVSTPPPEITDGTFLEDDDPAYSGGPITVQTGPAQAAITAADPDRNLPQASEGGFGAMWRNVSSGASDVAGGAAVATGLRAASDESFTVLVMGVDARPGSPIDIGVRPDVLMVVRFDPATESCRALSVPRDTRVELPGYGQSKINHALMVGGIPYQVLVTEDFLEIDIDHYLLIDFVAFQQIVDSVGGITVDVPEDLTKNGDLQFREGVQDFGGEEALAYARFRSGPEADRARIQRQWGVLASIADEMAGRDLVSQVAQVTSTIDAHLRTDLTSGEMTSIAKEFGGACGAMGTDSISMMAGTWVPFDDPILDRQETYNFVEPSDVERHVDALLNGDPDEPAGPREAPASPVPATPVTARQGGRSATQVTHPERPIGFG